MRTLLLLTCLTFGARADRTYEFPCEIASFAVSADMTMAWVSCFRLDPTHTAEAWQRPSSLYALDIASGTLSEVREATGWIRIIAAPAGARAIAVIPQKGGIARGFFYQGQREVSQIPIATEYLSWSADGRSVYFYGRTTIEADAWNILGVFRPDTDAISRTRLAVPTEEVNVCAANRHVFAGIVSYDLHGNAKPYAAAECDADLLFIRRNPKVPPGSFSATCRYVASPHSFSHGPVPWRVIDANTGKALLRVEFTGEGGPEDFEFKSWNPQQDRLLLRLRYRSDALPDLQVFDILHRTVVDSIPDFTGEAAWSRDGEFLICSRGQTLVFRPIQ